MPSVSAPTCPFCDLIRGAGEVSMCYEDADVVAFMDVQPVNAGHVLVVPREHFQGLDDIPHSLAMHLFEVAMEALDAQSAARTGLTNFGNLS